MFQELDASRLYDNMMTASSFIISEEAANGKWKYTEMILTARSWKQVTEVLSGCAALNQYVIDCKNLSRCC
jgi:hypothetical protein